MHAYVEPLPDSKAILGKALLNAGRLSQADLATIVGKDRISIARGLDPGR